MKTAIILSLLSFLLHIHTNAQNTIKGRVTDKVTRQPLESATVTLQQGGDGNIINYTLTDADGRFQLSSSSLKDRTITVFYMGYRKKTIPVTYQSSVNYRTGAGSCLAERSTDSSGARMGKAGYLEI